MFDEKGAMDSLGQSWNLTEEFATKLFFLTTIFMGIQLIFGFFGGIIMVDGGILYLIISTFVKYASLMPLFYLFYSLYASTKYKKI